MSSSGGAAASGGITFQGRVAAFYAVRVLAETSVDEVPGVATALACESKLAVDDVFVRVRDGGLYIQAKTTLSLSSANERFAYLG